MQKHVPYPTRLWFNQIRVQCICIGRRDFFSLPKITFIYYSHFLFRCHHQHRLYFSHINYTGYHWRQQHLLVCTVSTMTNDDLAFGVVLLLLPTSLSLPSAWFFISLLFWHIHRIFIETNGIQILEIICILSYKALRHWKAYCSNIFFLWYRTVNSVGKPCRIIFVVFFLFSKIIVIICKIRTFTVTQQIYKSNVSLAQCSKIMVNNTPLNFSKEWKQQQKNRQAVVGNVEA